MSRVLRVTDDNYKVIVDNGSAGTITLDTTADESSLQGTVVVRGNLEVQGTSTTIESTVVTINDNIIIVNDGQTGNGISASLDYKAGLEVDRGDYNNARIVFDDQLAFYTNGASGTGSWKLEDANGAFLPLGTNSIRSDSKLNLTPVSSIVSVEGVTNYEENVFNYSGGIITDPGSGHVLDDDALTSAKAVNDLITYRLTAGGVSVLTDGDTFVRPEDFDTSSSPSLIRFVVDSNTRVLMYDDRTEIEDVKIEDNEIAPTATNGNLALSANGTGSITTAYPISLAEITDPAAPADGTKIYSKAEDVGGTGVYFINDNSSTGELISKDKALLFAMLF